MATIQKREGKNGQTYRVMIRIHGYPPVQRTFKRLTDAKNWAQETELGMRRGDIRSASSEAKKRTLADAIEKYREDILPHKAISSQRVETTYLNHWERELGTYALSFLTHEIISKKVAQLTHAGDQRAQLEEGQKPAKPKSRKTVKHYRDNLEILLKYAQKWGWLGSASPMEGVNRITKANKERVRFLDDNERKALLAACKASPNEQLYPVVIFALSTGARKNEMLKLTLRDLDLERQVAILRETKNRETRKVPIVGYLKNVLEEHLKWRAEYLDKREIKSDFLFPRSDGKGAIDIRKAWENARDAAGIIDFRFHDLRHSAASYLAMNGASQLEIAEVLGHKTLQMVKRYSHLSEDHTRAVVEKMNDKIFQ
ncbi:MAG: tyrosine-type recombinase/integrase [Parasphingorhabdus sp.]